MLEISAISVSEIAIKAASGKLDLQGNTQTLLGNSTIANNVALITQQSLAYAADIETEAGALDASRAARALHQVVLAARAAHPRARSLWAAHLHAGA